MAKALEMSFTKELRSRSAQHSQNNAAFDGGVSNTGLDSQTRTARRSESIRLMEKKAIVHYRRKEYDKAYKLFVHLGDNSKIAKYYLGMFYFYGLGGVKKNLSAAKDCFEFAIKSGYNSAYFQLGCLYNSQKKQNQAFECFKKGAHNGDTNCMWALGRSYYYGRKDVSRDVSQAKEWIKRAADKGHRQAKKDWETISRK